MKLTHVAAVTALAALLLSGCGDDGTVAEDTGPTETTTSASPTAKPTVGSYPAFEPEDYSYHLTVTCFCLGAGVPIEVSVEDGEVVSATYLADDNGRSGVKEGDQADLAFWLTINNIIDAANDTEAFRVDVKWPPGQDWPSRVYVDKDENTVDEEMGYEISDVLL